MCESSLFLKVLTVVEAMTCSGSSFHDGMTLFTKKCSRWSQILVNCLDSRCLSPLILLAGPSEYKEDGMLLSLHHLTMLISLYILKYCIRSPLVRLSLSVVRLRALSLSVYDRFFREVTIFVALLCTCSRAAMSRLRYRDQACTAYSKCGQTNVV